MKTLLTLFLLGVLSASSYANAANLKIFSKKDSVRSVIVNADGEEITINRIRTQCAPINGWIQSLTPAPGITPVTELDVIESMKDADSILVDMRNEDHYLNGTIPTAVHISFREVSFRLDELGCEQEDGKWNCASAKKVYGFCNGPACPQSGIAMKRMIKNGFPANKLYYYRGGMMTWKNLGFTIVDGD